MCVASKAQIIFLFIYFFIESHDQFCRAHFHFNASLHLCFFFPGTPINKPPVLGYKDLNLFKLFRLVHIHGGCDNVSVLNVPTICLLYSASGK